MKSDKLRLFTGIELPETIRQAIPDCQCHLPGARWQTFGQLHLTVNFIGAVSPALAKEIAARVRDTQFAPFSVVLTGAGHFRTRAVWLGVEPEAPLIDLHNQDKAALTALGVTLDNRHYRPHVTLARMARGAQREDIARYVKAFRDFHCAPFDVRQLALFSSTPGVGGSRYEIIARSGEAR